MWMIKTMNLTIREATFEDYEAVCAVFEEGDAVHRAALPDVFRKPDGPVRTVEYVATVIHDPDSALFVAEQGQTIVGIVHVAAYESPRSPITIPRQYGRIDNLVVRGESRGHGIGQALLERAEEWVREKGLSAVELNVWEFNRPAIRFYENRGYCTSRRWMRKTL